jgi:hypothetical protein
MFLSSTNPLGQMGCAEIKGDTASAFACVGGGFSCAGSEKEPAASRMIQTAVFQELFK